MNVSLPGMDPAAAQGLIDAAHKVCPYSNATRGNIDVQIKLVVSACPACRGVSPMRPAGVEPAGRFV